MKRAATVKPFVKVTKATWTGRAGESATTSRGDGRRWVLHRWSDTGQTTLREIEGDGRTERFTEHDAIVMGITSDVEAAMFRASTLIAAAKANGRMKYQSKRHLLEG